MIFLGFFLACPPYFSLVVLGVVLEESEVVLWVGEQGPGGVDWAIYGTLWQLGQAFSNLSCSNWLCQG